MWVNLDAGIQCALFHVIRYDCVRDYDCVSRFFFEAGEATQTRHSSVSGAVESSGTQEMTIGDFLCCSAFEMDVRDYRCNQRPRTILRKERIHIASQTSYTLYDRLSPTPQKPLPSPDESSSYTLKPQ